MILAPANRRSDPFAKGAEEGYEEDQHGEQLG